MLLALALAAVPGSAYGRTQAEKDQAAATDWKRADDAMKAQYVTTMKKLRAADHHPPLDPSGEPIRAMALDASQRAWMNFRDAECVSEGYEYRDASKKEIEEMTVLGCKARLTRARTKQLQGLMVTQ